MHRLFALAVCALLVACTARAGEPVSEERWFLVNLQGKRAGWVRETTRVEGGQVRSESEMRLTIKRGSFSVPIRVESSFVETMDMKPVSMKSTMQLAALPTSTEYRFSPEDVEVVEAAGKAGAHTDKGKQALPGGEWLTPRGAEEAMARAVAAGETEVTLRSMQPETGLRVITSTHKLLQRTTLEVTGKVVPAIKWTSSTDAFPGLSSTDYTDERGEPIRTETSVGGIKLVVILADKELALADVDPPELLVNTLIKPDKPIDHARTLRRGVYMVESLDDHLPDLAAEGAQRFERTSDKAGRITVDLDAVAAAPAEEAADPQFTGCSSMITCSDEKVISVAAHALEKAHLDKDAPAAARAEALRAFVYSYINKKNLDVGFASAAEVARTRTGDCTEHGVLLCALLRASGIPARVVSGLVYVDGFAGQEHIFGYHMWAQALLENGGVRRWTDVDAALSPSEPFDATHIALAPSSLAEGQTVNALVNLAPLIGNLKLSVEEAK